MTAAAIEEPDIEVRRASLGEQDAIRSLVQAVVDEVYGGLWASPPLPIGNEDLSGSWIAVIETIIVGMAFTQEDWVGDLWIDREHRGQGVGEILLMRAEDEIASRGYTLSRLRVVSLNIRAIGFYKRLGWQVDRQSPHEVFPVYMTEMSKGHIARKLVER